MYGLVRDGAKFPNFFYSCNFREFILISKISKFFSNHRDLIELIFLKFKGKRIIIVRRKRINRCHLSTLKNCFLLSLHAIDFLPFL